MIWHGRAPPLMKRVRDWTMSRSAELADWHLILLSNELKPLEAEATWGRCYCKLLLRLLLQFGQVLTRSIEYSKIALKALQTADTVVEDWGDYCLWSLPLQIASLQRVRLHRCFCWFHRRCCLICGRFNARVDCQLYWIGLDCIAFVHA